MKMYGLTMECICKHIMKCFNCLSLSVPVRNLCLQPESSPINHLINEHLVDAWPTVIQMSPQLISYRSLIDPLLQHCQDCVTNILNFGMLGSYRLGAIIEILHLVTKLHDDYIFFATVRWPTVLLKIWLPIS